jgi:hypothetical protein
MTVAAEDRYHDSPDDLSCRGNLDHHNVTCMAHSDSEGETIDEVQLCGRSDVFEHVEMVQIPAKHLRFWCRT